MSVSGDGVDGWGRGTICASGKGCHPSLVDT